MWACAAHAALSTPAPPAPPQDAVSKGSPLLALLGFIVLPLVWSLPEALVTAGVWCCVGLWVGGGVGGGVDTLQAVFGHKRCLSNL